MRLTERTDALCTKNFRDKNKNSWKYIPVKQTGHRKINPKDIAGDTGCRFKKSPVGTLTGSGESGKKEKKLDVLSFRAKLGYSQREAGYIPCVDEAGNLRYVRVIRKSVVKILLPIFFLALIAGGLWWYLSQRGIPDLDEAAIAYQMPDGVKNEDPNEILMPGFGTITMDAGSTTVHAALANPEGIPATLSIRSDCPILGSRSMRVDGSSRVRQLRSGIYQRSSRKGNIPFTSLCRQEVWRATKRR